MVNDTNENIGKVDDLLVSPGGRTPYALLSVSGFLGVGIVAVLYEQKMALAAPPPGFGRKKRAVA